MRSAFDVPVTLSYLPFPALSSSFLWLHQALCPDSSRCRDSTISLSPNLAPPLGPAQRFLPLESISYSFQREVVSPYSMPHRTLSVPSYLVGSSVKWKWSASCSKLSKNFHRVTAKRENRRGPFEQGPRETAWVTCPWSQPCLCLPSALIALNFVNAWAIFTHRLTFLFAYTVRSLRTASAYIPTVTERERGWIL